MNIVLIGYRGTGKTVVTNILWKKLRRGFISIDAEIVKSAGMSIPKLVKEEGWKRFREIETEMVEQAAAKARNFIIDCGGGVVLNDENIRILKRGGKIVLLQASPESIIDRIKNDSNRPPLMSGQSIEDETRRILSEREGKYNAAADFKCDTTSETLMKTAEAIIKHFTDNDWL